MDRLSFELERKTVSLQQIIRMTDFSFLCTFAPWNSRSQDDVVCFPIMSQAVPIRSK